MSKEYTRSVNILGQIPITGQIVIYDDFENILHWTKYLGAGDDIFELDPTVAKQGSQSLYFKSRTTDAAEDDFIGAYRSIYLLPSKVMSFLGNFRYPSFLAIKYIAFMFQWFSGTHLHTARVNYNPNVPSWDYNNSAGAPIVIPGFDTKLSTDTWHSIILRANFAIGNYLSLQVNHMTADLSGLAFQVAENTANSFLTKTIFLATAGAAPATLYLDEIIIHEL